MTRVYYTQKTTTDIYEEAKANLEAYLTGEKEAKYVPQYVTSDMTIDGFSNYETVETEYGYEERPVFFVGWGMATVLLHT